jgi:hypothetical protein
MSLLTILVSHCKEKAKKGIFSYFNLIFGLPGKIASEIFQNIPLVDLQRPLMD